MPQLLLQLCPFQVHFSPTREDNIYACKCTNVGCELSLCSFPHPFWALTALVWLWVYVRVTLVAKYWRFQLAAVACVGEGRTRGQIRTGFPCRCMIWLLRSVTCSALLFWCVLSEVSEVSLAAQAMLGMASPAWQEEQAEVGQLLSSHLWGTDKVREPATILLLGVFPPISFPSMCCHPSTALSWSCFAKLKFLVLSQDLWGFKIFIRKLHVIKLHVCKLKQLICELSQVF